MSELKYLGQSLKFPLQVVNGKIAIGDSKEAIEQSLLTILGTEIGSRYFLPEYGSRLHELMFEQNDEILFKLAYTFIKEAIDKWEKRIKFIDVNFYQNEETLECNISYKILSTSEAFNFIFPFYRKLNY